MALVQEANNLNSQNTNNTESTSPIKTPPPPISPPAFELYDPRGLLSRRRSGSRGVQGAAAVAGASFSERNAGAAGTPGQGRDRKDSTATQSSLSSVREDDAAHKAAEAAGQPSAPIPIPSSSSGTTPERGRLARLQLSDVSLSARGPSANTNAALSDALTSSMPDLRAQRADNVPSRSQSPWQHLEASGSSYTGHSPQHGTIGQYSHPGLQGRHYSHGAESNASTDNMSSSDIVSPAAEFLNSFSAAGRNNLLSRMRSTSTSTGSQYAGQENGSMVFDHKGVGAEASSSTRRGSEAGSTSFLRNFIVPDPDEEGQEVDGYILEGIIGQGSFSTVRKATHIETGEKVAVKIVRHSHSPTSNVDERQGISWSDAKLGHSFVVESVTGQADGPKRVKRDTSRIASGNPALDQRGLSKPKLRRGRSCSSPSVPMKSYIFEGLPPSSDHDYYQMASTMSIDGSSEEELYTTPSDDTHGKFTSQRSSSRETDESNAAGDISLADPALQREVSIWSQLDQHHPHILPLLHYYEDTIASYIFMPLCERNLLQYVKSNGRGGSNSSTKRESSPPSLSASTSQNARLPTNATQTGTRLASSTSTAGTFQPGPRVQRSSSIRMKHASEIPAGGAGLPLSEVKTIFAQVVVGLRYLHTALHVTHKDIKLENILVDDKGKFKISDFGLAYAPDLLAHTHFPAGPPTGMDLDKSSPMSSPGSGPVTANPFKDDPKLRREHALSDGDAFMLDTNPLPPGSLASSGTPIGPVAFSSLGHAASALLPSARVQESLRNGKSASGNYIVDLTASTPASGFPASQPSVAQRRLRQHHAVPTSLMSHNGAGAFDATAGSLQYTSPEQIRSPSPISSLAVDIWALGCVLYALIDGRLPFDDGFEPRLRVNIMKAEWKLPRVLSGEEGNSKMIATSTVTASPKIAPQGGVDTSSAANAEEYTAEEVRQVEEILRGCLELDVAKRWTIQQVAGSRWLKEAVTAIEAEETLSPTSEVLPSPRGRKRLDLTSVEENETGSLGLDTSGMREPSRGRRPGLLGREGSNDVSSRSSSRPASSRRGPSTDEYRAARGGRPSSASRHKRSESHARRYGGEAANTWEIL